LTGGEYVSLISLAMIVKDEETSLARCLKSVETLVDEIIIVDTGSTDKTVEIARGFGACVRHFKWRDDFAAARNESLKYCLNPWVLILDADEAIDPLDHEKIKDACLRPGADAWELTIRNYMSSSMATTHDIGAAPNKSTYNEGKECPFYTDNPCLRLVKKFDGLSFTGKIHETIGKTILSLGKTIGGLDAVIHHYGKLNSDREGYKARYYFTLAEREAQKNPADKWSQFNLLQQALRAEQWEAALGAAQATIKFNLTAEPLVFYGAGVALQKMERHEEAVEYFDLLLKQNPKHALGILCKGSSYEALGNANGARELMIKAIDLQPSYVPAYVSLSELELRLNNFEAARKIALDAMNVTPAESALYDLLLKIELARDNRQQAAQDALRGIQQCPAGGEGRWHRLVAVCLYQTGETAAARSMLELGLRTFPNDPDLTRLKGMI
jgi:glycosyltransferase involved in cell wall biosynthesis